MISAHLQSYDMEFPIFEAWCRDAEEAMLVEAIQASLREAESGSDPSGKALKQEQLPPAIDKAVEKVIASRTCATTSPTSVLHV